MRNTGFLTNIWASFALLAACSVGQPGADQGADASKAGPPSLDELLNATYSGVGDQVVTLSGGRWKGPPFVEGGASAPMVGLVTDLLLSGDVDGDGSQEAVVLLWTQSGGSGTFDYIAVMGRADDGSVINTATAELGDRVKVQSAEIAGGKIIFDVIQAGPGDAMCCPGQKMRRTFALKGGELLEVSTEDMGRI